MLAGHDFKFLDANDRRRTGFDAPEQHASDLRVALRVSSVSAHKLGRKPVDDAERDVYRDRFSRNFPDIRVRHVLCVGVHFS